MGTDFTRSGVVTKVSVIIPVYNVENYLARCLDSVLGQTLKDIEIICVNDGSTDKSVEILQKYAKKDARIKVVNQKKEGVSVARNTGIVNATGEYIAFLDSDDFVDLDFYEKLFNNIEIQKADIACASIIRENEKKKTCLVDYTKVEVSHNTTEKFLLAHSPKYNFVWNKLYRRKFLVNNNLKFVVGMIYEDMCFTPDVLETSGCLITVPNTYYHYWKTPNSLIKRDSDKTRSDKLLAYQYLSAKCKKYNVIPFSDEELQYKKEFRVFGITLIKEYTYRVTQRFYLFGAIPIIEIRKKI